jgi:hypothetical protein
MGLEINRCGSAGATSGRFAVNEIEYIQRVALEMRTRPAWVGEMDETPSRLPPVNLDRRATMQPPVSAPRSVALQADWRIGFNQVSNVYRRQYR